MIIFFGFIVYFAFGKYGKIRLGSDDSRPEYSNMTWFGLLFGCGMGVGLVFWGVAEPLTYYLNPPDGIEAASQASANFAFENFFMHWGILPWANYAVIGLALAYFKPWAVINQGIGGGHDKKFHRGDIVLGEKVIPIGAVAYAFSEEGAGMDAKGFSLLPVEIFYRETGKTKKVTEYPCDERLLKAAEQVKTKYHIGRGVIGSGDEWNSQIDRITLLRERYHTAVEDMESGATAQLCLSYGVPFLGVRILSNSIVNGEKFDEAVGIDGQKFVLSLVDQMREYM